MQSGQTSRSWTRFAPWTSLSIVVLATRVDSLTAVSTPSTQLEVQKRSEITPSQHRGDGAIRPIVGIDALVVAARTPPKRPPVSSLIRVPY